MNKAKARIQKYLKKWMKPLGLLWWDITVVYYDDPNEISKTFSNPGGSLTSIAKTEVKWEYGLAILSINLPEWIDLTDRDTESYLVHELMHILVNEMHEKGTKHEERVVVGLQKAFMWCEAAFSKETKPTK